MIELTGGDPASGTARGVLVFSSVVEFTTQPEACFSTDDDHVVGISAEELGKFIKAYNGEHPHSILLRLHAKELFSDRRLMAHCVICFTYTEKVGAVFCLERRFEHFDNVKYHKKMVTLYPKALLHGRVDRDNRAAAPRTILDSGSSATTSVIPAAATPSPTSSEDFFRHFPDFLLQDADSAGEAANLAPVQGLPIPCVDFLNPSTGWIGTIVSLFSANRLDLPTECNVLFGQIPAREIEARGNPTVKHVFAPLLPFTPINILTVDVKVLHNGQNIATQLQYSYVPKDALYQLLAQIQQQGAHGSGLAEPRTPDGCTVAHSVSLAESKPDTAHILQSLLAAELNASDKYGMTPLSYAAARGDAVMVGHLTDALRRAGVPQREWLVRDKSGRHAADWAMERSMYFTDQACREIFDLLGVLLASSDT